MFPPWWRLELPYVVSRCSDHAPSWITCLAHYIGLASDCVTIGWNSRERTFCLLRFLGMARVIVCRYQCTAWSEGVWSEQARTIILGHRQDNFRWKRHGDKAGQEEGGEREGKWRRREIRWGTNFWGCWGYIGRAGVLCNQDAEHAENGSDWVYYICLSFSRGSTSIIIQSCFLYWKVLITTPQNFGTYSSQEHCI